MLDILRFLHSWTRWIVVIAAVVAALYYLRAYLQQQPYGRPASRVMTIFSSLIGLQWVIGLVFLIAWGLQITFGALPRYQWEHLSIMTIVVLVAHGHMAWRRREGFRLNLNNVILIVLVMALVVAGIALLPAPIQWRFFLPGAA